MLKFLSSSTKDNGDVEAIYKATLKSDKGSEALAIPVKLVAGEKGAAATVELDLVPAQDEEGAFDNLAEALERAAKAIRERGEANRGVPIYG